MTDLSKKYLIIILGPTGIGKTDLSISIAKHYNTEIISCDSRQFYKELKIGTAVPDTEQLKQIKHHFIGHLSITDYYNVSNFENDTIKLLHNDLFKNHNAIIMTGGSMMFIDAVCNGIDYMPDIDEEIRNKLIKRLETEGLDSLRFELKKLDPEYYNQVDLKNGKRIIRALEICYQTGKPFSSFRKNNPVKRDFNIIKIGLETDREKLYDIINKRVDIMLEKGLLNEAKKYHKYKNYNALNTVGYKELFDYFENKITYDKAVELIKRNTRRYARRQISWFKKYNNINWFNPAETENILDYIYLRFAVLKYQ